MRFLILIQLFGLLTSAFGFQSFSMTTKRSLSISMATTDSALKNLPRKLKRNIRSADAATFSKLLSPENDKYLKSESAGSQYDRIIKNLKKKAKQLKVTITPGFGEKAKVLAPTIIQTATAAGTFTKLLAAVQAAGLTDTLKTGLFTVFAPTDEAFAKLPEGKLEELLADIPTLTEILKFHVVEGVVKSKKIAGLKDTPPSALNGKTLSLKVDRDGAVSVGAGKVVTADLKCLNGIVHVIDTVLIPE